MIPLGTDRERPDFDDIKDAFERMTPSAAAEERMLASLLEASRTSQSASSEETSRRSKDATHSAEDREIGAASRTRGIHEPGTSTIGKAGSGSGAAAPDETGRRPEAIGRRKKHTAAATSHNVPRWLRTGIAACLVLAVGGGVLGYGAMASYNANSTASEQAAQFTAATPDDLTSEGEGTQPDGSAGSSDDPSGPSEGSAELSEDSSGSTLRDYSDRALSHPLVELSSGIRLRIALGEDGLPRIADASATTTTPETAWAFDEAGENSIPCYVRVLSDDTYPYTVSYAEDSELYLAESVS